MKICIYIGEGKSESIFMMNLIENNFNYLPTNPKGKFLFKHKSKNLFIFFPYQDIGGKTRLEKKSTYESCYVKLINTKHIVGNNPNVYCLIQRDMDSMQKKDLSKKKEKILNIMRSTCLANEITNEANVIFAEKEIESWFIASMQHGSKLIKHNKKKETVKLLNKDPDTIYQPKKKLNSIIISQLEANEAEIAYRFGLTYNLENALRNSKSFEIFYNQMKLWGFF